MDKECRIAVVGAGMMGREIAIVYARAGYSVSIVNSTLERAQQAKEKQADILDREIKKGRLPEEQKQEILNRITPLGDKTLLADYDFVIESVPEDFDLKESLFKELDAICKPECEDTGR